jgi:excisionase family DNA binding protein
MPPTTTRPDGPALFDADDLAALLRCSKSYVRRMADAGRMPPPIKLGKLSRWDRDVIARWIVDGAPRFRPLKKGATR